VTIIESRLTRLFYAAEIAQAMLRKQRADAVVGARMGIVEGAVRMVQRTLQRLTDEDFVNLDEERKVATVSNLLVILCSEQATQQVVNTGSPYRRGTVDPMCFVLCCCSSVRASAMPLIASNSALTHTVQSSCSFGMASCRPEACASARPALSPRGPASGPI